MENVNQLEGALKLLSPVEVELEALLADDFIRRFGIKSFTREEVERAGMPPHEYRDILIVELLIAQRMRDVAGPINIKYAHRSVEKNAAVKGAPNSDHLKCALDLYFADGVQARDHALEKIIVPMFRTELFEMGVGIGVNAMLHISAFCGNGNRAWKYLTGGHTQGIKL